MIYNGFGLSLLLLILFINVNTQSHCYKNLCNENQTCIMCNYLDTMVPKCFSNTTCFCRDYEHCFLINDIYYNAWKSLFKLVDFGYILKIDIINPISFTNQIELVLKNNDSKDDFIKKIAIL